ncbi:hypothetical protein [Proteiniphilum sp.]|uniref:hypothetical protein n=1 Tax=Proteiniphilum sp. TaxID=1926877 RepID=UPI002B1F95E5|nr:hypothetical protein [Proteiniphilum sp.]MEA4918748.1 hypothetical protein [Proteiniphilum sp.]
MKRIIIVITVLIIYVITAYSQVYMTGDIERLYSGHGPFEKRIEFNLLFPGGGFNSSSKEEMEIKLFGKSNAFVEFFHLPSRAGASGFRVVKNDSTLTYVVEIRYITNYEELQEEMSKKYLTIGIPGPFSVSEDSMRKIKSYNTAALNKQKEERSEKYDIESLTFPVSPQFAEELHKKMVSFIGNFKGKGVPRRIIGGHSVVFRNVVEDEVWSLRIKNPKVHPLKELCIQILVDAKTNQLDESKYMAVLNTL